MDNIASIPGANEAIVLRCRKDTAKRPKDGSIYWVERIKDPDPAEPPPDAHDYDDNGRTAKDWLSQSDGHDSDPAPSASSGITQISVGGNSFAAGDLVNVRHGEGLIYPKPVPILRIERYEDGLIYAVVDTEEMPRYHSIETLVKGGAAMADDDVWVEDAGDDRYWIEK